MRDTIFEFLRLLAPYGATGYVRIRLHPLHLEFCMFCRHRILFFSIQMPMCMAAFEDAPRCQKLIFPFRQMLPSAGCGWSEGGRGEGRILAQSVKRLHQR